MLRAGERPRRGIESITNRYWTRFRGAAKFAPAAGRQALRGHWFITPPHKAPAAKE